MYSSYSFSNLALDWVSGQRHSPAALCPGERTPGTYCTGGWVGPRAGLNTEAREKILSPIPGIEPRSPVCAALCHSLYWLSYPAYSYNNTYINIRHTYFESSEVIMSVWIMTLIWILMPTFRRKPVSSSSELKIEIGWYPEDGDMLFLRNVGIYI
jgi:hypothetical protein